MALNAKNNGDPTASSGPHYKKARQSRSAASEARFLRAAEQVFRENGYFGGSVSEIIRRSGQSSGSFYHRFGDKRQLLLLMLERYRAQVIGLLEEEGPANKDYPDLDSMLSAFATRTYDTVSENLGMYRAALDLSQNEPRIWADMRFLTAEIIPEIAKSASRFKSEITAGEIGLALKRAIQLIVMILVQTLLGNAPQLPKNKDSLVPLSVAAASGVLNSKSGF